MRRFIPTVFGIRDILVPIRIRGSVPLTNGSGSDSSDLKDEKKNSYIFLITYPKAHYFSLKNLIFC
jgi:hypothetical protein